MVVEAYAGVSAETVYQPFLEVKHARDGATAYWEHLSLIDWLAGSPLPTIVIKHSLLARSLKKALYSPSALYHPQSINRVSW